MLFLPYDVMLYIDYKYYRFISITNFGVLGCFFFFTLTETLTVDNFLSFPG